MRQLCGCNEGIRIVPRTRQQIYTKGRRDKRINLHRTIPVVLDGFDLDLASAHCDSKEASTERESSDLRPRSVKLRPAKRGREVAEGDGVKD